MVRTDSMTALTWDGARETADAMTKLVLSADLMPMTQVNRATTMTGFTMIIIIIIIIYDPGMGDVLHCIGPHC